MFRGLRTETAFFARVLPTSGYDARHLEYELLAERSLQKFCPKTNKNLASIGLRKTAARFFLGLGSFGLQLVV